MRSFVLAVLLSGCAIPQVTHAPPASGAESPPQASDFAAVERAVFAEINRLRRSEGLAALRADALLDDAAREHAQELALRRTLDHNSTDSTRRTPGMRVTAAGVAWLSVAENLAAMSGTADSVATQTGAMWLGSPGHRANLLNARFTHTGVGVSVDRRGVWYVTQVYVFPQGNR